MPLPNWSEMAGLVCNLDGTFGSATQRVESPTTHLFGKRRSGNHFLKEHFWTASLLALREDTRHQIETSLPL
jgi:hypothetical protein